MSTRVLRSAKGRARVVGEKGLIMGPVTNWGKKSIVISGGTQFTLEDMTEAGWEKLGKMRKIKMALHQAADAAKKIFEKDKASLHLKWLETEGEEIVKVGEEELKGNEAIYADLFAHGIAVQELEDFAEMVIREESETEIRDVVHVNGVPTGALFTTPRKNKGKERARDVSPSPAPRRRGQTQTGLSLSTLAEGLGEEESD